MKITLEYANTNLLVGKAAIHFQIYKLFAFHIAYHHSVKVR